MFICLKVGVDKVKLHAMIIGPTVKGAAPELRAIINGQNIGVARSRATRSNIFTTRELGTDRATSMAGHSRVQSSFRLAVRNLRPLARASMVKSRVIAESGV